MTNAKKAVERLTGYFPRSPAADEKIFLAGLTELLAGYPAWVIDAAANVRSGLPSRFQFMPSIAEVRQYCEKILDDHERHQKIVGQPALPAPKLTDDDEIVEALATRIRRRVALPIIETDRGRALLKQAIDKFLATTKKHENDLSILWLCDKGLLPPERRLACGQRVDVDKRMADAQRLGDLADALMRKTLDEFDQQFGT